MKSENTQAQIFSDDNDFFIYHPINGKIIPVFESFVGSEWCLNSLLSFQFGIGYNQSYHPIKGNLTQGNIITNNQFNYRYQFLNQQLLFKSKILYHYGKCWLPYFIIGLGASFNRAYDFSTAVPLDFIATRDYSDHSLTAFTYTVGLGIDYTISPCMRLGLAYQLSDLGKFRLGQSTIGATEVFGTLTQPHFYSNQLSANLTFIF